MRASSYAGAYAALLLLVCLLPVTDSNPVLKSVSSSVPTKNMTGRPGDEVHLKYVVPTGMSYIALEVIKPDLGDKYVFLFKDGRPDEENQHSSYKGRVELVDETLIIKNARSNDSGLYEFHLITETETVSDGNGSFGTKSSYNIILDVSGPTAGDENGGGGNGTDEDRSNEGEGGNIPGGGGNGTDGVHSNPGGMRLQDLTGLAVAAGLFVAVLIVAVVAVCILIRNPKTAKQTELSLDQRNAEGVNKALVQKQHTPQMKKVVCV